MTTTSKKAFMLEEVPTLLHALQSNTKPSFGLMTPQHMLEHLTWIIKSSVKDFGPPPAALTKGQMGFRRFLEKGAIFQHRPSDKTITDLPALKYGSLDEVNEQLNIAIERFYSHYEANPGRTLFHPVMGKMSYEEMELFHYQHCRYHFWQFGLLEQYP